MSNYGKRVRISELFEDIPSELCELFSGCIYPWEVILKIGEFLSERFNREGFTELYPDVLVGKGVKISPIAEIVGPAVICDGAEIRQGAYIRGNAYIGRDCVVGNSTEIKNALLLDGADAPHYNYVGDSILGRGAHMGAGAVASNLKSDKSSVTVHGDVDYPTGMRKLGAVLGDGAEIGCGCVLNPGTVVGRGAIIYPLTSVRGVVPEFSIMKGQGVTVAREDR